MKLDDTLESINKSSGSFNRSFNLKPKTLKETQSQNNPIENMSQNREDYSNDPEKKINELVRKEFENSFHNQKVHNEPNNFNNLLKSQNKSESIIEISIDKINIKKSNKSKNNLLNHSNYNNLDVNKSNSSNNSLKRKRKTYPNTKDDKTNFNQNTNSQDSNNSISQNKNVMKSPSLSSINDSKNNISLDESS